MRDGEGVENNDSQPLPRAAGRWIERLFARDEDGGGGGRAPRLVRPSIGPPGFPFAHEVVQPLALQDQGRACLDPRLAGLGLFG